MGEETDSRQIASSGCEAPPQEKSTSDGSSQNNNPDATAGKPGTQKGKARKKRKVPKGAIAILVVVVVVAIIAISLFAPGATSRFDKDDFITSSQLENAINIDELSTAEFVYNGIAEKYKDNGEDVDFRIAYEATVKDGISMSDVTFEVDNENKTVRPQLPEIVVNNVSVDIDSLSYMPENPDGNIRDIINTCEQDVQNEANGSTLLHQTAEENIQAIIEALTAPVLESKGYTIEWTDEQ